METRSSCSLHEKFGMWRTGLDGYRGWTDLWISYQSFIIWTFHSMRNPQVLKYLIIIPTYWKQQFGFFFFKNKLIS